MTHTLGKDIFPGDGALVIVNTVPGAVVYGILYI